MVKILMRRGSNSSTARRGVAGVEPLIRVRLGTCPSKGTVGRCLCLGDCVPRDNVPRTEPEPAVTNPPRTGSVWRGIPACQRSTNAFRFGLRGGSARHFKFPVSSIARNEAQNFVSRSCSRYRRWCRWPDPSSIALRAICSIQSSVGCRVIPAKLTPAGFPDEGRNTW